MRYHSLDSLRGFVMLLGIVFHISMAYITLPVKWFVNDPARSMIFDIVCLLIHSFRMPVFFIIAGFFSSMMFEKKTIREVINNRFSRIVFPFIIAVVFIIPLLQLMYIGGDFILAKNYDFSIMKNNIINHFSFSNLSNQMWLMHLWFLYYLVLFYLVHIIFIRLKGKFPLFQNLNLKVCDWFSLLKRGRIFMPVMFTALSLYSMKGWLADTPAFYIPELKYFLFYGVFYCFGNLLYQKRHELEEIERRSWLNLLLGIFLFFPVYLVLFMSFGMQKSVPNFYMIEAVTLLALSLAIWSIAFGLIGLSIKYLNKEMRVIRYLADSSFWLYLAHMPLVAFIQIVLTPIDVALPLKFLINLILTSGVLLFVYQTTIRYTKFGRLVTGKSETR